MSEDQRILKSEQSNGRKPPIHPNPNVVQILKKKGCSLSDFTKKNHPITLVVVLCLKVEVFNLPRIFQAILYSAY